MSVKKWVMSDEGWKLSDEKCLPKQALKLSFKKEEILGRIDTTITGRGGIIQSNQG